MGPKKLATTLTKKKSAQEALSKLKTATEQAVQAAAAQGRPTGEYVMEAANLLANQREEFAEADLQRRNKPLKKIAHKTSKRFDIITDVSVEESGRVMEFGILKNRKAENRYIFNSDQGAEEKEKWEKQQRQVYAKSLDTEKIQEIEEEEKEKEREEKERERERKRKRKKEKEKEKTPNGMVQTFRAYYTLIRWSIDCPSEESVGHGSMHSMVSNASSRTAGSGVSKLSHHDAGSILRPNYASDDSSAAGANVLLHLNLRAPHIPLYLQVGTPLINSKNQCQFFLHQEAAASETPTGSNLWLELLNIRGHSTVTRNTTYSDEPSNIATATALSPPPRRRHGSSSAFAYAAQQAPPAPPVPPKPSSGGSQTMSTGPASSSGLYSPSSGGPPFAQPSWSSSASAYAAHQPPPAPPVPPNPSISTGPASSSGLYYSSGGGPPFAQPAWSSSASAYAAHQPPPAPPVPPKPSMSTGTASSSGPCSSSSGAAPFAQPPWVTSAQGNPTRGNSSAQSSQSFSQQHKYKPQTLPPNSHPETEEEWKRRKRREQTNPIN
ncbi:hypothetical protein BU17DRAFT_65132 [Hysterangium stoloniferum]|nr:hypothetical protein BU17DRAFT_65132 [Hysterangium stoloniferum]